MGCPQSRDSEGAAKSKAIDQELRKYQEEWARQVKMLLLGPGESGKSTVFKQMNPSSAELCTVSSSEEGHERRRQ